MPEFSPERRAEIQKRFKYDPNEPYSLYWYDQQIERGIELRAEEYRRGLIKALELIISLRTDLPETLAALEAAERRIGELKSATNPGNCYCVCHSAFSSRSSCEHCKGVNEVSDFHLRKRIADLERTLKDRDERIAELEREMTDARADSETLKEFVAHFDGDFENAGHEIYGSENSPGGKKLNRLLAIARKAGK